MGPVDSPVSGPGSFCFVVNWGFILSFSSLWKLFSFFNYYIDHLPSVRNLCLGKAYYNQLAFSESSHSFYLSIKKYLSFTHDKWIYLEKCKKSDVIETWIVGINLIQSHLKR